MSTVHDLQQLAQELLEQAGNASSNRAGRTLYGGSDHRLRQTLVALPAGAELSEHENPGEATLQVLSGEVSLRSSGDDTSVRTGQLVAIPDARHSLHANADAVVLITVAKI